MRLFGRATLTRLSDSEAPTLVCHHEPIMVVNPRSGWLRPVPPVWHPARCAPRAARLSAGTWAMPRPRSRHRSVLALRNGDKRSHASHQRDHIAGAATQGTPTYRCLAGARGQERSQPFVARLPAEARRRTESQAALTRGAGSGAPHMLPATAVTVNAATLQWNLESGLNAQAAVRITPHSGACARKP